MFTITESESKLTAEKVFDQQVPNNFWIVTSFIIPKKYKNSDWWVVLFKNKKGEIVEGFKVLGSKRRIVYSASSKQGNAVSDIIGDSSIGWDTLFVGDCHPWKF